MNQTEIQNHDAHELANYRKGNLLIYLALVAVLLLSGKSLRAATYYWDGNGNTGGTGGNGTWSSTTFSTSSSGTSGAGQNPTSADTVNFNSSAGTITLPSSTWTVTNVGTMNFNADYIVTTSGSSTITITNASTVIGNNVNLTWSNGASTLGFKSGVLSGGTGSKLTLASGEGISGSTFRRINLINYDISNNVAINLTGNGTGYVGFSEGGGSSSIKANITNNTANTLVFGATSGNTLNVDGVVTGSGKVMFGAPSSPGAGTVKINNANTYLGDSLVNLGASGKVLLQANNGFSTTSILQHGTVSSASGGIIDLNGYNQTFGGLNSGASAAGSITNSSATSSALTVNQASDSTYGLTMNGKLALTKSGSGNLTLSGANTYSNGTTVSAGTLTASNNSALGTGSVTVGSGATLSIRANITNSVANSGTVSVGSGGSLTAASLGSGALSLAGSSGAGNAASFTSTQAGSSLSMGALTLGGYSSYSMDSGKTVSSSATITLSGTGNSITLTGAGLSSGTYDLFTGTSISKAGLSAGGLTLGGTGVGSQSLVLDGGQIISARTSYDFTSTATKLQLVVSGGVFNLTYNGTDGTLQDGQTGLFTGTDFNNANNGNQTFYNGDHVTLGTAGTLTVAAGGANIGQLTNNNSTGTMALSGGAISAAGLNKTGAGALQLANNLTTTAGITNSAGILTNSGNVTVNSGGLTVSGGQVDLTGSNVITAGGLNVSSGAANLNGATISAGGANVSGGTATLATNSSITGGIAVTGGTLNLNASNSVSGAVSVSGGGTLNAGHSNSVGSGSITLDNGKLGSSGAATLGNALSIAAGGGTITNDTALTLSGAVTGGNNALTKQGSGKATLSGNLGASGASGSLSLNVAQGELELSGANKYILGATVNGQLTVNGGTLYTRGNDIGGTGSILITNATTWTNSSGSTTVANAVTLADGSTLSIGTSTAANKLSLIGGLNGSGNVSVAANAATEVRLGGSGNASGTLTVGAGSAVKLTNFSAANLNFVNNGGTLLFSNSSSSGAKTWNGTISGAGGLTTDGSGAQTFAGNITAGGSFGMGSSGLITLLGENTFSGLNISGSGGVNFAKSNSLGSGIISNSVSSGLVRIDTSAGTGKDWILANNVVAGVSGTDVMAFAPGTGNALRLNGVVSGAGQLKVSGGGDLYVNNTGNSFTGGTEVGTGRIIVSDARALGSGAINFGTGTNSHLVASSAMQIANAITIGSSGSAGYTANLDTGANAVTISSALANKTGNAFGGNVVKLGSGNLTLSETSTYTGTTDVQSGTLTVNGSIASSSLTTVESGATLKGGGSVGALEIASGGKLAPGNSPGTLTASSATWNGGGTYAWEINNFNNFLGSAGTNYDFLNVTGALTINATSGNKFIIDVISLLAADNTAGNASNFNAASNYTFAIATAAGGITYAGGGAFDAAYFDILTSNFSNSMIPAGGSVAGVWSVTQSGNSINLNYAGATAIPEPTTGSLLLVGLLGALVARRRRS